jgi:hypothetical protein
MGARRVPGQDQVRRRGRTSCRGRCCSVGRVPGYAGDGNLASPVSTLRRVPPSIQRGKLVVLGLVVGRPHSPHSASSALAMGLVVLLVWSWRPAAVGGRQRSGRPSHQTYTASTTACSTVLCTAVGWWELAARATYPIRNLPDLGTVISGGLEFVGAPDLGEQALGWGLRWHLPALFESRGPACRPRRFVLREYGACAYWAQCGAVGVLGMLECGPRSPVFLLAAFRVGLFGM